MNAMRDLDPCISLVDAWLFLHGNHTLATFNTVHRVEIDQHVETLQFGGNLET